MIKGSCHCGAVSFQLNIDPEWLIECNCSICRRLGCLWAHAPANEIKITKAAGATSAYLWGDKLLTFHCCNTCGCTTHWQKEDSDESAQMAVNCRMCEPDDIRDLRIRHFDGADTWTILD